MSQRFYPIFVHKSEWERLKQQSQLQEQTVNNSRKAYLDELNEQSRKWMAHWPDSAEGVRKKLKEHKRKQRKEITKLKEWYQKSIKQKSPDDAVKRAKQLIFDDSCYGRQLMGHSSGHVFRAALKKNYRNRLVSDAINESNILDEREAQINFKKEIMQHEAELEKGKKYGDYPLLSNLTKEEIKFNRKLAAIECVEFNEELVQKKMKKATKSKAESLLCEHVDEDLVKRVLEIEKKIKTGKKLKEAKELQEFEAERKVISEYRKRIKDQNDALTAVYKKEQDRRKSRIDAVEKQILEEKRNGRKAQNLYKEIEEIQQAETKRYDDFIEKGMEIHEQRYLADDKTIPEMNKKKRLQRKEIDEENQIAAKLHKLYIELNEPHNKCSCDVQTLLFKSDVMKQPFQNNKVYKNKSDIQIVQQSECIQDKFSFLKPRDNLVKALRRREQEPSGFTGMDAKDKYFAEQASEALQRSTHKHIPLKVIADYIKRNHLNASDLSFSKD